MPQFHPVNVHASMAWESTFGTASTTNRFAPTLSGSVDVSFERNYQPYNRFGSNVPVDLTPIMSTTASISISGFLTNLFWIRAITGSAQTVTGTGPYTHTWSFSTTSPNITSATIEVGDQRFVGCVLENASISATLDEPARVNMTFRSMFAPSTVTVSAPAISGQSVFTYVDASLTGSGFASASSVIRSITMNFNPNTEFIRRIGSINPTNAYKKIFEISLDLEVLFDNSTGIVETLTSSLNRYSTTTDASFEFTSGSRSIKFVYRDVSFRTISFNVTPDNLIYARLNGIIRTPASSFAVMVTDVNTAY